MPNSQELDALVFALLFASDEPLSPQRIASVIEGATPSDIKAALDRLEKKLDDDNSSIRTERVAGGYQLATRPQYAECISRLYSARRKQKLSKAAMEALAIIAYKQPITRAEIERIRGVSCGGVISTLIERVLIKIVGKARVLGTPYLYGTTQEFLEYLGMNSLKDLPAVEELEELLEKEEYREEPGIGQGRGQDFPPSPREEGCGREETAGKREAGEGTLSHPAAERIVGERDGREAEFDEGKTEG